MAYWNIQKILLAFKPEKENLLPLLQMVNTRFSFISPEHLAAIANYFQLKPTYILSLISSSKLLKKEAPSQLEILVCDSPVCLTKNSQKVVKEIERFLQRSIDKDPTRRVNFKSTSCLGRCDLGPVIVVNGNIFTKVRPADVDDLLKNYLSAL